MESHLSPKEFAQVIDASESSIKRWVDKGIIRADITDGGHRRITVDEAIQYIRRSRKTVNRADLLGFPDVNSLLNIPNSDQINADFFFQILLDGDAPKARGYLLKLYLKGYSVADICDSVISDCMNRIGELWKQDEAGICIEHHATDICIQAINSLRTVFHPKQSAPIALGGAPDGDPYFIPSLCISTLLSSEGYRTINLGPNTPSESFERAIGQYNPSIVWISFTSCENLRIMARKMESLFTSLSNIQVQIIAGGRTSHHYRHLKRQNVFFGSDMSQLMAFMQGLKLVSATA